MNSKLYWIRNKNDELMKRLRKVEANCHWGALLIDLFVLLERGSPFIGI